MKPLFNFSNDDLRFLEDKKIYKRFIYLLVLFTFVFTILLIFGYKFVYGLLNPDEEIERLKNKNYALKQLYNTVEDDYSELNDQVEEIKSKSNDLRNELNLPPLEAENSSSGNLLVEEELKKISGVNSKIEKLDIITDNLIFSITEQKGLYNSIEKNLKDKEDLLKAIPSLMPADGLIGRKFGMEIHPIIKINKMHEGIDIITKIGTPVLAAADGKVGFIGNRGGYGLTVEIIHSFGYKTVYRNLSASKVKNNQSVTRGEVIALTGNSGKLSTGPLLHYEVRHNDIPLNPSNFIFDDYQLFANLNYN